VDGVDDGGAAQPKAAEQRGESHVIVDHIDLAALADGLQNSRRVSELTQALVALPEGRAPGCRRPAPSTRS